MASRRADCEYKHAPYTLYTTVRGSRNLVPNPALSATLPDDDEDVDNNFTSLYLAISISLECLSRGEGRRSRVNIQFFSVEQNRHDQQSALVWVCSVIKIPPCKIAECHVLMGIESRRICRANANREALVGMCSDCCFVITSVVLLLRFLSFWCCWWRWDSVPCKVANGRHACHAKYSTSYRATCLDR